MGASASHFPRLSWGFLRGHSPLELDFRAKPLEIPVNDGHRQLSTTQPIAYRPVSRSERSRDLDPIPPLGMTDIAEAKVILLGPEKWDAIKTLPPAENVARSGLTLTLGNNPVLHADRLVGQPVPAKPNIADREDPGDARLEILV